MVARVVDVVLIHRQIGLDLVLDRLLDHLHDLLVDIFAVEHLVALLVNDLALAGVDVVVFQNILADGKVAALNLALRVLNRAREHLRLERRIVVDV